MHTDTHTHARARAHTHTHTHTHKHTHTHRAETDPQKCLVERSRLQKASRHELGGEYFQRVPGMRFSRRLSEIRVYSENEGLRNLLSLMTICYVKGDSRGFQADSYHRSLTCLPLVAESRKRTVDGHVPCCPICGLTLRPGETEAHLAVELEKLDRICR